MQQPAHTGSSTSPLVALPLALIVIAFLVVMRAGEYQSLGPLDVAAADRLALALWVAAPIVGGIAAHRVADEQLARAGLALGLLVGVAVTLFFLVASGTGQYSCAVNLGTLPFGYPVGCLAVGSLTGAGMAAGFVGSGVATRRAVTLLPGIALAGAVVLSASVGGYELFYEAVRCLR
jgi:hypothetical protein